MKLPRFVNASRRKTAKGERIDFYFTIPEGYRPEGWAKNIRLPRSEADRRRDGSADEIAAVIRDASDLNNRIDAWRQRRAEAGHAQRGTLEWLMDRWRATPQWKRLRPKTASFYEGGWAHVARWSAKNRHPHISRIDWPTIFRLVSVYEDRPGVQRQVINVLQKLFQIALDEGVIASNPWDGQKRRRWHSKKAAQAKQTISYAEMLDLVALCDARGHPSMGTAVMIGFELMQYPEDIIGMRHGSHYSAEDGVFRFDRAKTGIPAEIAASTALRTRIGAPKGIYLIVHEGTRRPYLRRHFSRVFRQCVEGSRFASFQFRWLRHSGVKECDDAGLDPRMIDAIGAWKPGGSGEAVRNSNYRQHNADLAAEGMARRERFRNAQ